jgi:hypothetical protein
MPACTWHSPIQMCMLSRPVMRCTCAPRNWSGAEQDLAVLPDRLHDLDSGSTTAADVRLRLHGRSRVDVADDDRAPDAAALPLAAADRR